MERRLQFRINFAAWNGLQQPFCDYPILRTQAFVDHELLTDLRAGLYTSPPNNILTIYYQDVFALLVEAHRRSRDQKRLVLLRARLP